jgi:hypothetical protein
MKSRVEFNGWIILHGDGFAQAMKFTTQDRVRVCTHMSPPFKCLEGAKTWVLLQNG